MVDRLAGKNIYSVYHKHLNQEQGKESHPTFFLQRNKNKPYHIDYCFASADLYDKVKKATTISGPKYIHVHTPCPAGWGFHSRYTVKLGTLAVETGLFDLYEIENQKFRLTGASEKLMGKKRKPVKEYFKTQSRFKALSDEKIADIQQEIDAKWEGYARMEQC